MVNRQYNRGRAKEYRVMELLREEGWIAGRSAGSHSPVDIFAAKEGRVLLVQVKNGQARVNAERNTRRCHLICSHQPIAQLGS